MENAHSTNNHLISAFEVILPLALDGLGFSNPELKELTQHELDLL
jgi:hypothetical protein